MGTAQHRQDMVLALGKLVARKHLLQQHAHVPGGHAERDGTLLGRGKGLEGANTLLKYLTLIAGGQDPAGSRSGDVLCTSKGGFRARVR